MTGGIGGDTRDRIVGVERQPMAANVVVPVVAYVKTASLRRHGSTDGVERARLLLRKNDNYEKLMDKMLKESGATDLSRIQLCKLLQRLEVRDPEQFLTKQFGEGKVSKVGLQEWVFGEQVERTTTFQKKKRIRGSGSYQGRRESNTKKKKTKRILHRREVVQ